VQFVQFHSLPEDGGELVTVDEIEDALFFIGLAA
jgi:hypothetical protein